jgi:hypothetical protein
LLKEVDGRRYLIAANDSRREEETVLKIEDAPDRVVRPPEGAGGLAPLAIRKARPR